MNLSCRPFSQSSSVRCSITPPAAEPALLTMISTRPSALWPCSMNALRIGILAQVGGDGDDLAAGRLRNLLGGGFERLLAARADGDVNAFLRQRQCNALADALAAAGHQRRLALKFQVHRWFLPGVPLLITGPDPAGPAAAVSRQDARLRPACRMSRLSRSGVIGSSVTALGAPSASSIAAASAAPTALAPPSPAPFQSQRIERARRVLADHDLRPAASRARSA